MYKIQYILPFLLYSLTGRAQSEQQLFWLLNGSANGFVWDATTGNNRIDNSNGTWNNTNTNKTWTFNKGITDVAWRSGAAAIFGGNPGTGTAGTVTVSGTQTVQSLTFNPAASGTFTLSGGTITNNSGNITANAGASIGSMLAGSAGLTLSGSGTIILTGPATYTGTTTLNSGTLQLSNGIPNSTSPTLSTPVVIASGATLAADILTANVNLSGNISGAGTLAIAATGTQAQTMRLYGTNSSFTGNFSEPSTTRGMMWSDNGGTGNAANTGSAAATWNLSGSFGMIETAGSATPVVQLGSLSGTNTATSLGAFSGSGIKTFQIGALNTNTSFSGAIQDNPQATGTSTTALIKVGSGTLTISGNCTYSGTTTVTTGTLALTGAFPTSTSWNIGVNATSTPSLSNSGKLTLANAPPLLSAITINIQLTGTSTGFTWQAVSWTGTSLALPTLQINGTTVISGVANGGTTVTYTAGSGVTVTR